MSVRFGLLDVPFPLKRGYLAHLLIPANGLTTLDAERLHAAIDSLTTDPPPPPEQEKTASPEGERS